MTTQIAVFCKPPVAGSVKTRLIPAYGAARAAAIYRELAERTLATVARASDDLGAEATLWVAGDAQHPRIREWSSSHAMSVHEQRGDDLGARMLHCLQSLGAGGRKVLLVGTDCAALAAADFAAAANRLDGECRWVFVPAEDGGYVLVGSAEANAVPFTGIAWSTAEVMAQTRAALTAANQRWAELPPSWDIDEPADVDRAVEAGLLATR